MKSAVRIALMLALVAAMFVHFGSYSASAQQQAVASATPTPAPTIEVMVFTHGDGPGDGDEYMVKNANGKPIKRKFNVIPEAGWQNINVLDVSANKGTFFRPDQVADLRFMTDDDKAQYTAQVLEVHGHGNSARFEMPACDGTMPWDINFLLATNHIWNTSQLDYVELFAYIKNGDGSRTKVRLAKFTWLGSTALRVDEVHPWAQLYQGDRGASHWIYPGNELPLQAVPNAWPVNSWMYWPGLVGISLNMKDPRSPFMNCIGIGGRIVNTVGQNDTWFGILDMVEMRKGVQRRGDGLFYGVKNGLYPSGEVCGETAACTPPTPAPICVKTINWQSPEDVLNQWCGRCDFPVPVNSRQMVRYANWNAMSILMRGNGLMSLTGLSKLQANFGAGWVSINRADCHNLEWVCILDTDLSVYGIQNTLGLRTVRDLFKKSESVLDPWSGDVATIDELNRIFAALQAR